MKGHLKVALAGVGGAVFMFLKTTYESLCPDFFVKLSAQWPAIVAGAVIAATGVAIQSPYKEG